MKKTKTESETPMQPAPTPEPAATPEPTPTPTPAPVAIRNEEKPKEFPYTEPEADKELSEAIRKAAKTLISFIRPKSSRYRISYSPNAAMAYILPLDFYPSEYVVRFDFEEQAIIVTNSEHKILVGWTPMPEDIKEAYQQAVMQYKTMVRPLVENEFKEYTTNFSLMV